MITHTLATRYPNSAFFGDSYDMVKKIDESKLPTLVKGSLLTVGGVLFIFPAIIESIIYENIK